MSHDPPGMNAERDRILAVYAARPQGDYSFADTWHLKMIHQREALLAQELKRAGITSIGKTRILDVGCGKGTWLRLFNCWGAPPENLRGCDISEERLVQARRLHPAVGYDLVDGRRLPYEDGSFDLVVQSTVFSSILDKSMRRDLAQEMVRVLKDDGAIIWFDLRYDNPWNRDVRGMKRKEITRLFPECRVRLRSVGLLPPLARGLARISTRLTGLLGMLPPLRYAYLGIFHKRNGGGH